MSEVIKSSVNIIAKGTTIIVAGTIINLLISFLCRIIFVRYTTQAEYGIYSLVLTITAIFTTLSTLGLNQGSTRFIAYYNCKDEIKSVQTIIYSSLILGFFASVVCTIISIYSSEIIATRVYKIPEITSILNIVSLTIPFVVLTNISVAIFRGFGKTKVNVFFNNILKNVLYFLFLVLVVLLGYSFIEMIYAYIVSLIVTGISILIFFYKNQPIDIQWKESHINNITRELLFNSIPLLATSILLLIMAWTDTLMLGYFQTPDIVGAYNAVYPIAHLLSIVVSSIAFLYLPVISKLYSKNQITELGSIHSISTKWSFMLTLPLFFIMFVFPDFLINTFFGSRYIGASVTLQILAIGCLLDSYFGFNYYTLLSAGKSKLLMISSLISAMLNVLLNYLLIPKIGMVGAAIASTLSFTLVEIYMTVMLYRLLKIHPFQKSYLKITLISILSITFFYVYRNWIDNLCLNISIYILLYAITYALLIVYSRSLDKNDFDMLKYFSTYLCELLSHLKNQSK